MDVLRVWESWPSRKRRIDWHDPPHRTHRCQPYTTGKGWLRSMLYRRAINFRSGLCILITMLPGLLLLYKVNNIICSKRSFHGLTNFTSFDFFKFSTDFLVFFIYSPHAEGKMDEVVQLLHGISIPYISAAELAIDLVQT